MEDKPSWQAVFTVKEPLPYFVSPTGEELGLLDVVEHLDALEAENRDLKAALEEIEYKATHGDWIKAAGGVSWTAVTWAADIARAALEGRS